MSSLIPGLDGPAWPSGSTNPSPGVNTALERLAFLARGGVLSRTTDDQPAEPSEGDAYIMTAGRTGDDWSTYAENDVAAWLSGAWFVVAPADIVGVPLLVNDAGEFVAWDGASYAVVAAGGGGGGGDMDNPMTTAGDIIVGGASGAPTRLAIGANGHVLKVVDGALVYAAESGGGGGGGSTPQLQVITGFGQVGMADGIFRNPSSTTRRAFVPVPRRSGKHFFAVRVTARGALGNLGIGVMQQNSSSNHIGDGGTMSAARVGSWGLFVSGGNWLSYHGSTLAYGGIAAADGDVLVVYVDFTAPEAGKIWWQINGTVPLSGDPAAGTNPAYSDLVSNVFPASSGGALSTSVDAVHEFDFTSASPFGASIASGFDPWVV